MTYQNGKLVWFWGGEFSNFYKCTFEENDIIYNCSEQYFMAKKALLFNDMEMYDKIMKSNNPKQQKGHGRKVKKFNEDIWNSACEEIMFNGNLLKYTQNEDLKNLLLATENKEIVEASPYDKIWGVGIGPKDERIQDKNSWNGQNKLGICLMKIRDQLKN
jgi:ribA/ribD-fused uncharacterized protein